jgi:hypothetical protein
VQSIARISARRRTRSGPRTPRGARHEDVDPDPHDERVAPIAFCIAVKARATRGAAGGSNATPLLPPWDGEAAPCAVGPANRPCGRNVRNLDAPIAHCSPK